VISSTPCRAFIFARSPAVSERCSGLGSQMLIAGAVSVRP
jgi:hypothetical protein